MELLSWLQGLFHLNREYVSSVNSREQLYHRVECECPYCQSIRDENKVYFKTRIKAEMKGLRMCRICRRHSQQKSIQDYT